MTATSSNARDPDSAPASRSATPGWSYLLFGFVAGVLVCTGLFSWKIGMDRASGADGHVRVLRLAHGLDQNHPVHKAMVHWSERVADLSSNRVQLQVFPNGQLGSEPECTEQVQRGALAFVKTSTAALEGFIPEMAVFSVPYLFRDSEHFWEVLGGEIGQELLDSGLSVGVKGIVYYDAGSRSFYTNRQPVLTPTDLRGQKIRVLPSRTLMDMVSMMGGAPTTVPWGELYTALQQGMVDGAENNPPSFETSRHYEVARHFSMDEHVRLPDIVLASKTIWETLSPVEQGWILEAANDSVDFQRKLWEESTRISMDKLRDAGVQIHEPDKEPFRAAVQPMVDALIGTRVGDLAVRISAVGNEP